MGILESRWGLDDTEKEATSTEPATGIVPKPEVARTTTRRRPRGHERPLRSRIKIVLAIGAVAASPFVINKIADSLGNREKAPWQNQPAHIEPNK